VQMRRGVMQSILIGGHDSYQFLLNSHRWVCPEVMSHPLECFGWVETRRLHYDFVGGDGME
jgi:hypothetical protein